MPVRHDDEEVVAQVTTDNVMCLVGGVVYVLPIDTTLLKVLRLIEVPTTLFYVRQRPLITAAS